MGGGGGGGFLCPVSCAPQPASCSRCLQVLHLLAEDRANSSAEGIQDRLGYTSLQLAISAASTGLYLVDLLHMRCLRFSPMSIADPDAFLKACQGMDDCT